MPLSWQSRVDKLLRGALPELVRSAGKVVFDRQPSSQGHVTSLMEKLRQQASRVAAAQTHAELFEELADTFDAVLALAAAHGITAEQLAERRREPHAPSPTPAALAVLRPSGFRGVDALRWILLERGIPHALLTVPGAARSVPSRRAAGLPVRSLSPQPVASSVRRAWSRAFAVGSPVRRAPTWRGASVAAAHGGGPSEPPLALRSRGGLRSRALGAHRLFYSAVTQLGVAPRTLMRPARTRPQPITASPRARFGVLHARAASAATEPTAPSSSSRYLPVLVVGASSTAAVWFVSVTSRAVFRYVVRPYLVRYAHGGSSGTRLDQGSRALVRLLLPSLAT